MLKYMNVDEMVSYLDTLFNFISYNHIINSLLRLYLR